MRQAWLPNGILLCISLLPPACSVAPTGQVSDDEGRTWRYHRILEEGFSGYSDLAALPDGRLLCFYERGSTDGENNYRPRRLTVARFDEEWVRAGP